MLLVMALAIFGRFGRDSGTGGRRAQYFAPDNRFEIAIELTQIHPYLAEYSRVLVLSQHGKEIAHHELFLDTGGYAAANLYRCKTAETYEVKGYFDSSIVDAASGTISNGSCFDQRTYLGTFDGAGRLPWRFYTSDEREERPLEPRE